MKSRLFVTWLSFAAVLSVLAFLIISHWQQNIALARQHFIETSHKSALSDLEHIELGVRSIYENIRTLSQLPSLRNIDRHATNLSDEAYVTFQQIYNNLASNVDVSEVYIVPIDLNPTRIDPVTLRTEEPILMFDQLILNAGSSMSRTERLLNPSGVRAQRTVGPPEIEEFEYRQLVEQANWLRQHYSSIKEIDGLKTPFISSPELITCDNTKFIRSHKDSDRSGVLFSVPFYDMEGNLKGLISTTMLTSALRSLLPSSHLALVNPAQGYTSMAIGTEGMAASRSFIATAKPDPSLIYSEALALDVNDNRSPWYLWSGQTNESFYASTAVKTAERSRDLSLLALVVISIASAISIYLTQKNIDQSRLLNQNLVNSKNMIEKSEAEARETTEKLHVLNDDISRLNNELSQKIKLLTEAQEDIVKKGQMAQLGNLVATVAHELRNPLGGVRNTAFMLRRKLKDSPIDVSSQLLRIESGITRCDKIISQLLDFSRTQPLIVSETSLHSWLQILLEEEVPKLPSLITVNYVLDSDQIIAEVDPERLRRGVINLLSNASEAIVGKSDSETISNRNGSVITVGLAKSRRGVELSVADNGPGIPPEILEKIGEPLFTTKSFGTGLGIAAVQKIATLHGGGLEIESELGHGARFILWFPLKQTATKAA